MKTWKAIAGAPTGLWFGLIVAALIFAAGCEPYDFLPEDTKDDAADKSASPAPETPATPETPAVDTEKKAPPPVTAGVFRWEPRGDSVRIIIPASMPHWRMGMVSPTIGAHVDLHTPDRSGGRRVAEGYEYIRSGDGAYWKSKSLAVDPRGKGAVVVTVHTNDRQPDGFTAASWYIADPTKLFTKAK